MDINFSNKIINEIYHKILSKLQDLKNGIAINPSDISYELSKLSRLTKQPNIVEKLSSELELALSERNFKKVRYAEIVARSRSNERIR